MKKNFTVFYSWQSDIKVNRNFIKTCLENAIKEVVKNEHNKGIELKIDIDTDTANRSGSPEIADTILKKISSTDIFICDVTIVNKSQLNKCSTFRLTPNPNVLFELGYAVNSVGWERVICINNTQYSTIENLPFDIKGHRITSFDISEPKKNLSTKLKTAIEFMITNYEDIIKEQQKASNKFHDLGIYEKIDNICNETILLDSISLSVNSLHIDKLYLSHWDNLREFYKLSINLFIDKQLDELMITFLKTLNDFDAIITQYFHLDINDNAEYSHFLSIKANGETLTENEEFEYKQFQIYKPHKEPFRNETWGDADIRIRNLQISLFNQGEKVKTTYRELILNIKQKLM